MNGGDVVWRPDADQRERAQLARYVEQLGRAGGSFADEAALHRWSIEHLEDFWRSVVEFEAVSFDGSIDPVLPDDAMPGAEWFPALRLNYAEHLLRHDSKHAQVGKQRTSDSGTPVGMPSRAVGMHRRRFAPEVS